MKIVADQNMPLVQELFGQFGEVKLLPGRDISADTIADAEMLLVRSVTRVNESLLSGSSIKFVGSATAGIDHIDTDYLATNNIHFAYAPGCNAQAVVEYVLSAFCNLCPEWQCKTVGIVGCGHVGGRLFRYLKSLGVNTRVYDPLLSEKIPDLCVFDDLYDCDIISLHTPLTFDGPYPTFHLFNEEVLDRLNPKSLLINTSRGEVVDNQALFRILSAGKKLKVVLDVWEGEPNVNQDLLDLVPIATPHIAGYSDQGKIRGTSMLLDAAQVFFSHPLRVNVADFVKHTLVQLELESAHIGEALLACYNVANNDNNFRHAIANSELSLPEVFDGFRKNYPQRNEYSCFRVSKKHPCSEQLVALGFDVL